MPVRKRIGPESYRAEMLERRVLLAATLGGAVPPDMRLPAGFVLPKSSSSASTSKIQSQLSDAVQHLTQPMAGVFHSAARTNLLGAVQMDIAVTGKLNTSIATLAGMGIHVGASNASAGVLEAFVPPALMNRIAQLKAVKSIGLPDYVVASAGSIDSAGDSVLNADKVRAQFAAQGIDGTGVKIGIISDGVDHRANVGSDLPAITIDPNHPGSGDEGTAMLEIVHDLAPGAQLYFSGPQTSLDMIDSIAYLQSQGCTVIADDLSVFGEPDFQDGLVAQAAQAAVDAGVVYVSAAGNASTPEGFFGISHYQHEFVDDGNGSQNFFDDGENGASGLVDDTKDFLVQAGATFTVVLQWSDLFGASNNDYDLYLFNNDFSKTLAVSTATQNGTQNPIEGLSWTNDTGSDQVVQVLINKFSGAARELEMFTFGNGTGAFDYNTQGDAIVGQQAAAGVIAAGVVDSASPNTVEPFSSQGPSTIYTNFVSQTKIQRNTLRGVAVDDVETVVGQDGFFIDPFFGTSVAAPHTAAIAALIRQTNPSLTPTQVTQVLEDTATDLSSYGVGFDQVSGAGRFNALDAVYKAFTPAAPDMTDASDSGMLHSDNITNDNTPVFSGTVPAASYVTLFVDGVANSSVKLSAGITNYTLTAAAIADGDHAVSIRVASSSSVLSANFSNASSSLPIKIDTIAPSIVSEAFNYDAPGQNLTVRFNEDLFNISAGIVTITDTDNTSNVANIAYAPGAAAHSAVFTFPGMPLGLPDGNYSATLNGTATDIAGNAVAGAAPYTFFVLAGDANHDRTVNALDFNALAANYGQTSALYSHGDFDDSGTVDTTDFDILAQQFGKTI